jgi:hypothetical protein
MHKNRLKNYQNKIVNDFLSKKIRVLNFKTRDDKK